MADAIYVSRQTISTWEKGEGKPDIYYLHEICKYFNVSIDQMMYGRMIGEVVEIDLWEENLPINEFKSDIYSYKEKGLYTIIDEDLENFFEIIRYDFVTIMTIALALHQDGYTITEIFMNGFSICFKTDDEAKNFYRVLYNVLDCFIHHDNEYIESKLLEFTEPVNTFKTKMLDNALKEIYGADINSFKFFWVDNMENPRGYANSEEECKEQAAEQGCENCHIFAMV